MSDEAVSMVNSGADITRACVEIVLAHTPPGDRTQIDNLKQIIHQQALAAGDLDISIALRVFFGVFQNYIEAMEAVSPLNIVSRAISLPDQREDN